MARLYGLQLSECPFAGADRKAWEDGWRDADALI